MNCSAQSVHVDVGGGIAVVAALPADALMLTVLLGFARFEGVVSWDGLSLEELGRRSIRSQVGWVPQEPVLLSGSVRQNVLLGRPEASEQALWMALDQAHAADCVRRCCGGPS